EHVQAGVAHGLAEEQARLGTDGLAPAVDVAGIDESRLDPEPRQGVLEQVVRAAIERARSDDVRAGAGNGRDGEVEGSLARCRRDRAHAVLERGDPLLEDRYRRVA